MTGGFINKISLLGTGWLGLPLAQHLLSKGYQVKGSTRSKTRFDLLREKGITPFVVDIDQANYGDDRFWDSDIAIVNIPCKNVSGFTEVIKVLEKTPIQKLIFISSTSVYEGNDELITEEDTGCLINSKLLEIEAIFNSSLHFDTTIVRFGGLIGYSRNPARFFKAGKVVNNPLHSVNMIHRDDCVNIIHRLVQSNVWGEVFNCCTDTHPSKKDFYTYAAKVSGLPAPQFSSENTGHDKVIDNSKIKKHLNYNFLYPDLLNMKFEADA